MLSMTDSAADAVRRLVASKIKDGRLDMTNMSLKLEKNRTYIQQYITKGSPLWLPEDVRAGVAAMIGVPESDLRRSREIVKKGAEAEKPAFQHREQQGTGDRIKVLGMAECGPDGWSLWNGEVVDMIPCPPVLSGAPNGFAVYVVGTSMEDRYHPGEIVFIHPGRPVTPGSYVLVQMHAKEGDAPRAFLKRLVKQTGDKVILQQFEPKKTFTLKRDEILSMYRVVGSSEA